MYVVQTMKEDFFRFSIFNVVVRLQISWTDFSALYKTYT